MYLGYMPCLDDFCRARWRLAVALSKPFDNTALASLHSRFSAACCSRSAGLRVWEDDYVYARTAADAISVTREASAR